MTKIITHKGKIVGFYDALSNKVPLDDFLCEAIDNELRNIDLEELYTVVETTDNKIIVKIMDSNNKVWEKIQLNYPKTREDVINIIETTIDRVEESFTVDIY